MLVCDGQQHGRMHRREQNRNLIVRSGIFEAETTNNKRLRSTFYIEAIQTRSIARPLCDSRASWLPTLPAFDAPIRGFPSEYRHPVWHGKTRMAWLPDGEKILKLCLFVLTQLMNVTDTRTHTAWQHMPRLCIASRGKKRNEQISMQTGTIGKREKGMKRSSSVSKGQRLWSQETGVRISSSGKGIIPDVLGSVVSVVD